MRSWQRKLLLPLFSVLALLPLLSLANSVLMLKKASVSVTGPTAVQITLTFTQTPQYKWFLLSHPDRLVIDLQQTANHADFTRLKLDNTLISKIRAGGPSSQTLRLVFDLTQRTSASIHLVSPPSSITQQLLIKLTSTKIAPASATHSHKTTSPETVVSSSPSKPVISMSATTSTHKTVVVIDPGHGGKDPGASGANGQHEKDIVLAISRDLYKALQQDPNVTVYMTRYGDYYIGLRQRLQLARRDKADIFVAVHADAYKDAYSVGASVFALSVRGASSEAARWLAEKENYSELGGVNLEGKNDVLRSVLIDLSQTASISSSLFLGSDVLAQIGIISPLHKTKVEQAPFVVLKSPDIPSILVETGFISNPNEERALSNAAYQQKMAQAIESGIELYLKKQPPMNGVM